MERKQHQLEKDSHEQDVEVLFEIASAYESEDRKSGNFPYDDNSVQTIRNFYAGKDIFITGGTGFVGKVLIEKILRSLPEGGRIYLILRSRKGLSPQQRIQAMLKLPLFELLMTENPKAAERLVAVEGDCTTLGLGLSLADRQTITDNVSIVFHCAATVNFNRPLSYVILMNTRGTREMVYLVKALKKLDAFVYVSTAFTCATSDRTTPIPEEVLPASVDWRTIIAAAEKSSQSLHRDGFNLIFEKLQTRHPNNYTFSKLLCENLVEEESQHLPTIIVRPSILLPTYEDPFGGWIDNLYGPLSLWNATSRGIMRVHYGDPTAALQFLPVDMNVKTLITAAWCRGLGFRMRSDPEKLDVVNSVTGSYIDMSFEKQTSMTDFVFGEATHKDIFRYPRIRITNHYWVVWFVTVVSHLPLGILLDTLLRMRGQKPILLQAYRRIFFMQTNLLHYFSSREFHCEDKYQWIMEARIPNEDKPRFSFLSKNFQWAYAVDNLYGVIKYVFKETPVKHKQSNRTIMLIVDWIQNAILVLLGLWIFSWMAR